MFCIVIAFNQHPFTRRQEDLPLRDGSKTETLTFSPTEILLRVGAIGCSRQCDPESFGQARLFKQSGDARSIFGSDKNSYSMSWFDQHCNHGLNALSPPVIDQEMTLGPSE